MSIRITPIDPRREIEALRRYRARAGFTPLTPGQIRSIRRALTPLR